MLLASEAPGDVRRVPVEAPNAVFGYGSGDEHVKQPFLEIGKGTVEGGLGGLSCFGRRYAQVDFHLLIVGGDKVDASVAGILGRVDDVELHFPAQRLQVIGGRLGRAIDDGGAQFKHGRVFEGLEDDFVSHAIGVAMGDGYSDFLFFHIYY